MAANPGGPWMEQMARNLVDAVDGFLVGKRYVLIDRDPLYTEAFRRMLGQGRVEAVRWPRSTTAASSDFGTARGEGLGRNTTPGRDWELLGKAKPRLVGSR